jgi:hypothetical protein
MTYSFEDMRRRIKQPDITRQRFLFGQSNSRLHTHYFCSKHNRSKIGSCLQMFQFSISKLMYAFDLCSCLSISTINRTRVPKTLEYETSADYSQRYLSH